jgi:hypothetical protein
MCLVCCKCRCTSPAGLSQMPSLPCLDPNTHHRFARARANENGAGVAVMKGSSSGYRPSLPTEVCHRPVAC